MTTLVNLTPHDVNIIIEGVKRTIESTGVARIDQTDTDCWAINGIPVIVATDNGVIGLPEPQNGVVYIVSGMIVDHPSMQERNDIVAPATGLAHKVVRDETGRIAGVTRLRANASRLTQDCNCGSGFPVGLCPQCDD